MELLKDHHHFASSLIQIAAKAQKHVDIATFGIFLPPKLVCSALAEASTRVRVRLLVGVLQPTRREVIPSIMALQKRLRETRANLPDIDIRTYCGHVKLYMNEAAMIVGGRNLSFSPMPDLSFREYRTKNPATFDDAHRYFRAQWVAAQALDDFLALDEHSLGRDLEEHLEAKMDRVHLKAERIKAVRDDFPDDGSDAMEVLDEEGWH